MERVGTGQDGMRDGERLRRDAPVMPGRVWAGSGIAFLSSRYLWAADPVQAPFLAAVCAFLAGFGIMVAVDAYAEHAGVWDRYWRTKARERARDGAEAGPAERRLRRHDGRDR